ncbi:MAG TPA: hypothetical protein VHQ42_00240 [Candidatus Limnocylindria bacterium]|nr:hypothetical protein [Candidatus Limnocylindria bacterium]
MSNRIVAALAAGALVVGILVGAAGAVLVGNATAPDRYGLDGSMGRMMPMMGGPMMGGLDVDDMAELHAQHHGTDR